MARVRRKRNVEVVEAERGGNRAMWLGGILVLLLLAVAAIVMIGRGDGETAVDAELYEGIPVEGTVLGDPDAPVLIREIIDFKCPHCATAAERLVPDIIENYVAEGQVRMAFIPVDFLGDQSLMSAQAAYCAAEQDAFMEYHDVLFANHRNTFNITNLTNYAERVGLDTQQFRACLTTGEYRNQVIQENRTLASQLGATSTPTFVVNDTLVAGAVPFEQMQAVIEQELETVEE
ncbi:MAG: DsbA family protein [Chloroflexota bacterium]|nr:DsbA family protein [Chloroflexota bacterium]